jgi:hypothetical protein
LRKASLSSTCLPNFLSCFVGPSLRAASTASATTSTAKSDWSCFESTVAIVGRSSTKPSDLVVLLGSRGRSRMTIVTAGHCVESLALQKSIAEIQIYAEARWCATTVSPTADRRSPGTASGSAVYDRDASYFHHDRGMLKLTSPLPPSGFPESRSTGGAHDRAMVRRLQRIGFGQRRNSKADSSIGRYGKPSDVGAIDGSHRTLGDLGHRRSTTLTRVTPADRYFCFFLAKGCFSLACTRPWTFGRGSSTRREFCDGSLAA